MIAADCAAVCGAGLIMLARPGIRYPQNPGIVCLDHPQSSWKESAELFKNIEKSNSILIGPGLEINKITKDIFRQTIKSPKIKVVDASAIDLIRQNKDSFPLNSPLVITPHQGELKRLANALGFHESPTLEVARKIAIKLSIYVILKGPQSKVISPKGKISYNSSGSAALSCAGSGDALAGILVSLLANSAYQDQCLKHSTGSIYTRNELRTL